MLPIIENNKLRIAEICKKHFVKSLYIFGSVSNGNWNEQSDLDFIYQIDIEKFPGWDTGKYDYTDNLFSLEEALTLLLKRPVDLIPDLAIRNKYFKKSVEESKQLIYAA